MPEVLLLIYLAGALIAHLVSNALVAARYLRAPPPLLTDDADLPFISMVRTVHGMEEFSRETLLSGLHQDYPHFETLFCAASPEDPVLPLVRDLMAKHRNARTELLIGTEMISQNPKLNNMVKGYRAARGDWVCFTDSNVLLPTAYLRRLVSEWRETTGILSSPSHGVRAANFWGDVEVAFLNTHAARWQLALDSLGLGLSQGKTLFLKRSVIESGGGIEALADEMAEDAAATKLVLRQGLRPRLTQRMFPQPIGHRTAKDVSARFLRWSRLRRDAYPLVFAIEALQGLFLPFVAALFLWTLGALPGLLLLALPLVWFGAETALARTANWPFGRREIIAMFVREAMLPALWIATWFRRDVVWRGTQIAPRRSGSDAT